MLSATDTFLKYLQSGLPNDEVHWVRTTESDPTSSEMRLGAVNVSILALAQDGALEEVLISLDIMGTDERDVLGMVARVRTLLWQTSMTSEIDFDGYPIPRARGSNVCWNPNEVTFVVIDTGPRVVHYNATFELRHVR